MFLGLRQGFGDAVLTFVESHLLEPRERPAAFGVEIAFLLGERFVEHLIDEGERLAYRDRLALGVEHPCVARVDAHAGADGGLREVDGGDVAGLQEAQRAWEFGLQRGDIFAAGGDQSRSRPGTTNEDDTGC
jgi:hypothetical protein